MIKVLIHACPRRLWYAEEHLAPALRAQGAEVEIWNDAEGLGNLRACMAAFASRSGDGGTWHIQDDVLPCRDFVRRCEALEGEGVVYGFANAQFTDDLDQQGRVYAEDAWHSFQCVRIPDSYARDCAAWIDSEEAKLNPNHLLWIRSGKMDDTAFRTWLIEKHGRETVYNAVPNLVEHVDWIVGGSVLHPWRGHLARAEFWDDEDLVSELKEAVRGKVRYE